MCAWEKRDLGDAFFGLDFLEPVDEYNRYVPRRPMNVLRWAGTTSCPRTSSSARTSATTWPWVRPIDRFISLTWRTSAFDILLGLEQTSDDTRLEVYVNLFQF